MRSAQATVIGDAVASNEMSLMAERIGEMLARHAVTLFTGGHGGVMEAASKGAARAGGLVIGIVPGEDTTQANSWCTAVVPTGLGHARNILTALAGDFVIVLGGGAGTLSEMSFAWIHHKPILAMRGFGGWADKVAGTALDRRRKDSVIECNSVEQLESEVLNLCRRLNLKHTA